MNNPVSKKVASWRWRMVKACGSMKNFCDETKRAQSQVSEWVNGVKTPEPESIEAMETDLKARGA